ncbi:MAG: hypothetical protein QG588_1567 [Candidatus Poribacteria bacterium]|nr:hypothetical protein [Candidatus Poribacteria bacterium]
MSAGNRFGFSQGTIPIQTPKPLPQPSVIPEPIMINAPMPLPDPFIVPSATVINFTFEDGNMIGWTPIDEPPALLGGEGPSRWGVADGPISGKALVQTSNIWGDKPDVIALGTFLIYDLQEFTEFVMEFDIYAMDNDGVGVIWGWKNRTFHYRFFTMIDPANPAGAPPDQRAPFTMIQRRMGDISPYYQTLAMKKEASFLDFQIAHYKLEVSGTTFKVYWNNVLTMQASDPLYQGGKIGFMLYAHSGVYFDNVRIESVLPPITNQMERFMTPAR